LEIEGQLELHWCLHWQVGRFFSSEDSVHITCRTAVLVGEIRSIGNQAAARDEQAFVIDRGQFVLGGKPDDQIPMARGQRGPRYDQSAIRRASEGRKGALDLSRVTHIDRDCFDPNRGSHGLDRSPLADPSGYGWISDDSHARDVWRDLLEQLQPFHADSILKKQKASGIAAWPRQAVDEARADRIGDMDKHNWNVAGRL